MPEDNPDQIGPGLSASGGQEVNAGELLAELVRLVDSGLAPKRPTPVETPPEQKLPDREPTQSVELKSPPASLEAPSSKPKEAAVADVQPTRAVWSDISHFSDPSRIGSAARPRSGPWTFWVSALVLVGAAVIAAIFWLRSELADGPTLIAAAQSPTPVERPSSASVAPSGDAEASPPKDASPPTEGKAVGPDERPVDLTARDSLVAMLPPSQDLGTTAMGAAQQTALPAGAPPAGSVDAPSVAEPATAPPPTASQPPDSQAAPTVSLPPEPTPTPPSAPDSGVAALPSEAPLPPVRPTAKAATQASAVAQKPTPKLELPAKLSSQSAAHMVAKASATGAAAAETKTPLKPAQVSAEPQAASPAQAPPAPAPKQPNSNPVARAFGSVAGAVSMVTSLIPFVPH